MRRVFVGDIHGSFGLIPRLRKGCTDFDEIIIVGDVGVGFNWESDERLRTYLDATKHVSPKIRFIRGNHDDPEKIKTVPGYIEDGTIENGTLYVGGAYSIDKDYRIPGLSWWRGEELSDRWWHEFLDGLKNPEEIHTVVTHDCPDIVLPHFHYRSQLRTNTGGWLNVLLTNLPNVKTWVFGHHHRNLIVEIDGVKFFCLDCGGYDRLEQTDTDVRRVFSLI